MKPEKISLKFAIIKINTYICNNKREIIPGKLKNIKTMKEFEATLIDENGKEIQKIVSERVRDLTTIVNGGIENNITIKIKGIRKKEKEVNIEKLFDKIAETTIGKDKDNETQKTK